jgi:hypothetical protein
MAEKPPKRTAKPERVEEDVLGTLPASRPERLSKPRAKAQAAAKKAAAKQRAARARGTAKTKAAGKPKARAKPRAATRIVPPAEGTILPPANTTGAAIKRPAAAATAPPPASTPRDDAPDRLEPPRGVELLTTTVRAVGELTQFGAQVGVRAVKRTFGRSRRP